jgi:mannose-6-phosphate isomerase-like protein (cupin superfamily)
VEEKKGFILLFSDAVPPKGDNATVKILDDKGQIRVVKNEGKGNPDLQVFPLLRPASVDARAGSEPSMHQWITLAKLEPGGVMEEHYFEHGANMPVFDITLLVISGRIRVTIGDIEKTVGPNTLIYVPSNLKRSVTNVGKVLAQYVAIKIVPSGKGEKMGDAVYSKMPNWSGIKEK